MYNSNKEINDYIKFCCLYTIKINDNIPDMISFLSYFPGPRQTRGKGLRPQRVPRIQPRISPSVRNRSRDNPIVALQRRHFDRRSAVATTCHYSGEEMKIIEN